ncbi:uncharacterized protein FFB20_04350 [Fusarium fujikuroi]|uniref:Uncharacterized protein n=1 Tax=Fusarium fujikuroi TaxID=5127 RepID=A0A2H3RNY2_FUSFU|nr:hypothetical protein CEK27_007235 [Fusarium fujikuroi]QGI80431.1 hypothetical protein CEK25_007160 [Fusarium fujikuroi]QGI80544.1 hypothetical protein CEK25_007273 [Fusarium fujikuroi]SCN73451.1 uncharacterized protein FFB20_04350 [Fusarium fujikuroi]SCN90938.1 uncharacterized protein FFC1_06192 [Fusarium fujikuroi]
MGLSNINPKHVTYPMRLGSDGKYLKPIFGEEEIPMFQSVTHMECFPYRYCFFVKSLPPRPWPLTVNGRPFTITPKTPEDLSLTPIRASNPKIFVGNPDLRICVNIDARQDPFQESSLRAMVRDVTEMFSSHPTYPKVMEVMLTMDQKIVILVSSDGPTGTQDSSPNRRWPGNAPKLPLFPGTSVRGSQGTGNPEGRRNAPHFAVNVSSGVLIKNQEDQHMMTTAGRIVRPGEVVGTRVFFFQNRIGLAVDVVPGTDVALVKLDDAINYKNQDGTTTFTRLLGKDPDDALPWNSIVSLATRWPPYTKGIIVAKSVRVVRHTATTHYRVYHWAWTGQPGNEKGPNPAPRDPMIGAAAISETGVVTGLLHSNEHGLRAGYSIMLSASELVDVGYSLVT